MKFKIGVILGAVTCFALSGCGKDKAPTGQVVATIDDKEITAIDLRQEMGGFVARDAKTRNAAERAALDQIITRKLLAAAATEAEVEKTPDFAQREVRMREGLLVQTWQEKIAKNVPPPSRDEAEKYVAEHPDLYAGRKVLVVDQIIFARPKDQSFVAQLQPLTTLPEIIQLLTSRGMSYRTGSDQLDLLRVPPQVAEQILKLPPNEMFVLPAGNMLAVNQVREARVEPVPADVAIRHATQYLKTTRVQEAVRRELGAAIAARRDEVKYAKAYEPVKPGTKAPPSKAGVSPTATPPKG